MSRLAWYGALNLAFALFVVCIALSGSTHGVHTLYLILLFAICTNFVVDMKRLNDRYLLLALFSAVYFVSYGVIDLEQLSGLYPTVADGTSHSGLDAPELVILVGGALAQATYRISCRSARSTASQNPRDWAEHTLVWVGIPLWIACAWLNWIDRVDIFVTTDNAGTAQGLASTGSVEMIALMLAAMLQPLSMLLIFYAQSRYRRRYMLPLALAVMLFQAFYGFVVDIKGEVMLGGILMVLTKLLVGGKLPKLWLLGLILSIAFIFPVLQANRMLRGENDTNHAQAAQNIGQVLKQAFAARDDVSSGDDHAQTFLERSSLKGSVEMIVDGTGVDAPYQHGHTLTPLVAAFIPKIIWPSKPDVQTGQLLNKAFHVSDVEDTYISPSHLGELYWNFGWAGVVVGMSLIGLLFGFIGARYNLADGLTLTRLLVIALTARLLILGFEGAITNQYVVWLRSMLAIGLLHVVFSRYPSADVDKPVLTDDRTLPARSAPSAAPFPNLMS